MKSVNLTREQLLARVAPFSSLSREEGGFPDSDIPGCQRAILNVLGYEEPEKVAGEEMSSPLGDKGSASSAIPVSEGINIGFVECTPGEGVVAHNHDTNETFTVINGRWRFVCNDDDDMYVDLEPLDTISFPTGVERRFTNLSSDRGDDSPSLVLVAVAGDRPGAFFRRETLEQARTTGKYTAMVERRQGVVTPNPDSN